MYEDILHITGTLFAAANQRQSVQDEADDVVTRFYWADSADTLLRAAHGYLDRRPTSVGKPPDELLLPSMRNTYGAIFRAAAENKMTPFRRDIVGQGPAPLFAGVCLVVARKEYYFMCQPEEEIEIMDWSDIPVAVIAYRPIRMVRLEGAA